MPKIWDIEDERNYLSPLEEGYYTFGPCGETHYIDSDGNICSREEEE